MKLDLSANGLDSKCGGYIANVLSVNFSLSVLSLADNELLDEFIDTLVTSLKKNVTLFECDLTGNPFTTHGANVLYNAVQQNTIATRSFGNLGTNGFIDITMRENLKGLMLPEEELNYPLLRPIEETNPEFEEFLTWNLVDATL